MAKLPDGWIFIPTIEKRTTVNIEERELVMCRNCKWGEPSKNMKGEDMVFCYNGDTGIEDGYLHEPNWFCAEGKKKTGD